MNIALRTSAPSEEFSQALLFGVHPGDAATVATVTFTIAVIAALASWLPAWRASRLDPNATLRAD